MAEYSKLITTKKGEALVAKVLTGAVDKINFTTVVSSGARYEVSELEDLTELEDIKQTSLISHKEIVNDVSIKLQAAFTNTELTTGYYMRTLGLFAEDPDEGSVLFAVTVETTGNCYMPAYNGVTVSGASIVLITTISNAENVNLEVDPAAIATANDVNNVRSEIEKHTTAVVSSETGVHGFRYFNNVLQIQNDAGKWVEINPVPSELETRLKTIETDLKTVKQSTETINSSTKTLTTTLTAGESTISFTDDLISTTSTIDIYTSVYGVSPTNASIEENTLTLEFKAQETDMDVKVVIS